MHQPRIEAPMRETAPIIEACVVEVRYGADEEDDEAIVNWCQVHRMQLTEEVRSLRTRLEGAETSNRDLASRLDALEQEAADLRTERGRLLAEANESRLQYLEAREEMLAMAERLRG